MSDNPDEYRKVLSLDEHRAKRRPAKAVDADSDDDDVEDDGERFVATFQGDPDEIFDQFVEFLGGDPEIGGVIAVRPQLLILEDEPDEDVHGRYDDAVWEETLPMWDVDGDDGEPRGPFDASVLLELIRTHPDDFKAMLGSKEPVLGSGNSFLEAFYQY
ncbi:hypothetical protein [Rhizobium rhizosphaerae]|nr:hypothetical protein [Xaviernesmea rhizosphaerae]